jgi:hypothetical protein
MSMERAIVTACGREIDRQINPPQLTESTFGKAYAPKSNRIYRV